MPKVAACGTKTCTRRTSVRAIENNGVPLAASAVTRLPTSIRRLVTTPSKGALICSNSVSCSSRFTAASCATTFAFATATAAVRDQPLIGVALLRARPTLRDEPRRALVRDAAEIGVRLGLLNGGLELLQLPLRLQ